MNKSLIAICFVLAPAAAHADVVSDRVFLQAGAGGCPTGQTGFARIKQYPDGTQVKETTEFAVPVGYFLEITSVEYTTPYDMMWAKFFAQYINVDIRQRGGSSSTNVLTASYGMGSTYYETDEQFHRLYHYNEQGPRTEVASFPVGPLMSAAGRLCVSAKKQFWDAGGNVRVRGRFVSNGTAPMPNPGGGVLQP
jgi:hypothetical protein